MQFYYFTFRCPFLSSQLKNENEIYLDVFSAKKKELPAAEEVQIVAVVVLQSVSGTEVQYNLCKTLALDFPISSS